MGFAQGVSGLTAAAANLDVIGNNISNSGTVGYKSASVQFANVYAGSALGLGTKIAGVFQDFSPGAVQTSTKPLDVAIINGDGFFRLTNPVGEISYSRNGQFDVDKNGYVVNAGGLRLTGYEVGANGALAGGSPVALKLSLAPMTPVATQNITAQFNIDARAKVPATTPFKASDSTTYNYSNSVTMFDSLGNSHELSTFFVKTATNSWATYATADGWPLDAGGAKVAAVAPATTPPSAINGGTALTTGVLGFTATGTLTGATPVKININGLDFNNGASVMNVAVDITGTTQFGVANDVRKMIPDGYATGLLTTLAVNKDGTITGKYSNQQATTLGQIVLSSFVNQNGLQTKGDNVWAETATSGPPLTGTPGSGSKLGALVGGATEASNVDLTSELVNLIIAQRTYQANAQTVKTQDQVVQTLMNMR